MKAGTLIVDIAANLARLQADMAQAKGIVEAGSREIERSVAIAKSALGALGITLSVGFFAKWIEGSYEAQAGMLRLAQTAGTTVEVFSSLRPVMKNSQTDAEEVAKGMQKLAKSMAESGDGTTKAAKVFDVLKVSVTDATGALRPTQDVMRELGGKLMSMRDQTLAVAFAQEVLGKAGANLLPFLYELARTGELQAKVTTEQARAAKEYEDNLNRLKSSSEQYRNHVANELLPTLNSLLEKLNAIKQAEGGGFVGFMAKLGIGGDQASDPIRSVEELDQKLAFLQERLNNLKSPDSTGFLGQFATLQRLFNFDDIAITEQQIAYAQKQRQVLDIMAGGQRRRMAGDSSSQLFEFAGGGIPTEVKNPLGQNEQLTKRYEATLQSLTKQYYDLQHAGSAAFVMYETEYGTLRKLDDARKAELMTMAKKIDAWRNEENARAMIMKGREAEIRALDASNEAVYDQVLAYKEERESLGVEISLIGASSREIEKLNAVRAIELDLRRRIATLPHDEEGNLLPGAGEAVTKMREQAEAQKAAVLRMISDRQRAERDWLTGVRSGMNEYVELTQNTAAMSRAAFLDAFQGMEDALVRFVTKGKLDFSQLIDTIKTDLARLLIRQQITGPLAEYLGGSIGSLGSYLPSFGALAGGIGAGAGALQLSGPGAGAVTYTNAAGAAGGFGAAGSATGSLGMWGAMVGLMMAANSQQGTALREKFLGKAGTDYADPIGALYRGKDPGYVVAQQLDPLNLFNSWGGDNRKQWTVFLQQNPQGQWQIQEGNRGAAGRPLSQYTAALNDPTQFDQSKFPQVLDWVQGDHGQDMDSVIAALLARLAPAHDSAVRLQQIAQLGTQQADLEGQLGTWAAGVPDALGIKSLEDYKKSLAVSTYSGGPMDRLGAARTQYDDVLARARGGDLEAIGQFPQVAQQLLGMGRDVYASGGDFQDLFTSVNQALQEVLDKQRAAQLDILKDVPTILLQSNQDQLQAIKDQTNKLTSALSDVKNEIARLRAQQG
jgi:lambda family phage tail tape measure protein